MTGCRGLAEEGGWAEGPGVPASLPGKATGQMKRLKNPRAVLRAACAGGAHRTAPHPAGSGGRRGAAGRGGKGGGGWGGGWGR